MRNKFGLTLFSVVMATVALGCVSFADDSASQMIAGGTLQLMDEHTSIKMVSEDVDIKLGEAVAYDWRAYVRCQFIFRNDGPATDVWMGFPEKCAAGGDSSAIDRLMGFKSWVDGQPMALKYVKSSKNEKGGDIKDYKAWYVKKVHFDAGQTRRVVDVYSAYLGYVAEQTSFSTSSIVYILQTGRNWKGPIGKAVINVDVSTAGDYYEIDAGPNGCRRKHNKLTWVLKNIEPKEDICVVLTPKAPLLNGKKVEHLSPAREFFVTKGVLMVSLDDMLYYLGGGVEFKGKDHILRYGKHALKMRGGSRSATLDGKKIRLSHAPWEEKGSDGAVFAVPLEETVRLLGGTVKYDSHHRPNVILKPIKGKVTPKRESDNG